MGKDIIGKDQLQASKPSVSIASPDFTGLDLIDVVQLYEPRDCLRCTALLQLSVQDARAIQNSWGVALLDNMNCHYSKGNDRCPAGSVRLIRYADIDKAVDAYMDAFAAGDVNRLAQITNVIQSKDQSTSALVMTRIREHLANLNAPTEQDAGDDVKGEDEKTDT